MQGTIEAVKQWPDGGISVKLGQEWYKTKNIDMVGLQGRSITFNPSPWTNPSTGKVTNWINDYVESGAAPGTADEAMNQAIAQQQAQQGMAQAPQTPVAQPMPPLPADPGRSPVDRDASIVAQALAKSVTHATAEQAWASYVFLYNKVLGWNPGDFDDEIPF